MNNIFHDFYIEAPSESVFKAITIPSELNNWWPLRSSGKPELGAAYNFYFTPEYDWYGEVTKSEAARSFHIKMTRADEDWEPTSFGFDLEEMQGGTQVHFRHTGWPACNHHFKRSSYCWAILLKGLKDYVEKGVIVPFEERE